MRISLEQWRALVAVVDAGGYAQAGAVLNKSQSTVSYALQKLEAQLGLKVLVVSGRKAVLTPAGRILCDRARLLIDDAGALERAAQRTSAGWEAEIWLAIEILFPTWLLLACLDSFSRESPHTHVELLETVLDGTPEALTNGRADLGISPRIPPNFTGEPLMPVRFLLVAHPGHPLHSLKRELTMRDLRKHRHILVRDTGTQRDAKPETLQVAQRWTVTNMATSIGAVCRGYGFAWFPEDKIRRELDEGILRPLRMKGGGERHLQLYLVFGDQDLPGPGVRRLAEIVRAQVATACRGHTLS